MPSTTYLYLMLKMKARKQTDNTYKANMYSSNFLEYINWTQPTFKKHLSILNDIGIVLDYNLPKTRPMTIHIDEITKQYTQVDSSTVNKILTTANSIKNKKGKIKNHTAQAIRLYYYYEKNFNVSIGYAYPTYKQINNDCRISEEVINLLNNYFKEQNILYVEHGKKWYVDTNTNRPRKENNRYIPLLQGRVV